MRVSRYFLYWEAGALKLLRPLLQPLRGQPAVEKLPFLELGSRAAGRQPGNGLAESAAAGGGKRYNGLAGKVIALQKGVDDGGGYIPPDGELKCSPSSPALENTGLNGLHKCVFCSFLVAYCSDLSHLLYSASPVYTNTYV